jgi:hypothetical protein
MFTKQNMRSPASTVLWIGERQNFEIGVASLVGVASLLGLLLYWPVVFPLDDAYITLHNARVLLTGGDENYDVPALVGATSAVHLVLVAGLGLFLDLPLASFLLNALAAIAYAVGLARLALWAQSSRWVASGIIGLGLLAADAPYHLFNGLETGLAMAAVVWGVILALSGSQIILPVLCGLMPFIRPELAALAGSRACCSCCFSLGDLVLDDDWALDTADSICQTGVFCTTRIPAAVQNVGRSDHHQRLGPGFPVCRADLR